MKKSVLYVVIVLICSVFVAAVPTAGEEKIYDDVMRLHIIANSDTEEDQELKLKVRDRILEEYGIVLSGYDNIETAKEEIWKLQGQIMACAAATVKENGYNYDVSVSLSYEEYPTRKYTSFSMPAGKYLSFRVMIGDGKGQNWWCVLFPPLCMSTACSPDESGYDSLPAGLTLQEYRIICDDTDIQYKLKFKTLELLEGLFGE